ncbi:MAG: SIMPL domain-containing protein [Planctomycetes bacterium]|nr:SIMPL domain-containing protein [Planctomycetota bacterium]
MARFVCSFLLMSCCVASADEFKLAPRHVAVTGTSITRVQPDTVVWHVSIRRDNKDLAKATADADAGVRKVLALRDELKLKPEDVQTGYLTVQKIYDRDQAGNQTSFRNFQVIRTVSIRQRDTSRFDEILAQLTGAADVEVSYSLESSEYHAMRTKTRLEAVSAARKKATEMTELLGSKVGRVLRIAEPHESFGSGYLGVSNSVYSAPRAAEPDQAPGTFAPGAIEVKVSIEVAFEIIE